MAGALESDAKGMVFEIRPVAYVATEQASHF
jgi:hypothetical protein